MRLRTQQPFGSKLRLCVPIVLVTILGSLLTACGDNTATPAPATTVAATSAGATNAVSTGGIASSLGPIAKGSAQLSGPIIIGLNTEITGAGSQTGDLARKAAEIAVEKINAAGGINGQKIELKIEDAASTNPGALAALNKANEDKAFIMVGPVKSTQIQAISERIKELQMPSLIGGTNANLTKVGNQWLFRFRPDDSIAANAMVNYALNDLKATKIAILHDSDAFGTGGADIIEEALKKAGKPAVTRQKYTTDTQDFTAQLLAIKSAGADTLCLYTTNQKDGSVILRQIKEQGLKLNVIGSPSYSQTLIQDLPAEITENVNVVMDYFPGRTPENQEYAAAWKAKYNSSPDSLSAWNWDAIHLASQIIAQVGTDKNKFREALLAAKGWKGAVGTINFNSQGNGLNSVDLAQYKAKTLTFVKNVAAGS
jgi:branched-chain amino acid transport system substrate-binding protein